MSESIPEAKAQETFRRFADNYLRIEELELARLRASMARNADKPWPAEFREGLRLAREGAWLDRGAYLALTSHEFDSEADYRAWLDAVWAFLYEDGPDPS